MRASSRSADVQNGRPSTWSQWRWESRIVPSKGSPPRTAAEAADAGAGVEDEAGRVVVVGDGHARGVPPVPHEVGPGGGNGAADPEQADPHAYRRRVFVPVALGQLAELGGIHAFVGHDGDPAVGHRHHGGGTTGALDARALAQHRTRAVLGQALPALVHPQHAVQDQEDVGPGIALGDQRLAALHLPQLRLAAAHHLGRQRALEGRLDGGDQGGGVLITPRGVPSERLAVPVAEVGEAGLGGQPAGAVVDPVPGEAAGPPHLEAGLAVDRQGQAEGRPHQGGLPLDVGTAPDPTRCGQAGPSAGRLGEAHPAVAHLGRRLQVRQRHGLELMVEAAHTHGGRPQQTAPRVSVAGHLAAPVGLHPRRQHVGEPEPVGRPQCLEVLDDVGRRVVVVGEPGVECHAGPPAYRFRWDPREAGDGALDSHSSMVDPHPGDFDCAHSPSGVGLAPPRVGCLRTGHGAPDVGQRRDHGERRERRRRHHGIPGR